MKQAREVVDEVMDSSELRMWMAIESLGWGTRTTNFDKIAKFLKKTYSTNQFNKLLDFVVRKQNELSDAFDRYRRSQEWHRKRAEYVLDGVDINIYSDDGFNDVTAHIVGLGRAEFERNIHDPFLIAQRYAVGEESRGHRDKVTTTDGYVESFRYCFSQALD